MAEMLEDGCSNNDVLRVYVEHPNRRRFAYTCHAAARKTTPNLASYKLRGSGTTGNGCRKD